MDMTAMPSRLMSGLAGNPAKVKILFSLLLVPGHDLVDQEGVTAVDEEVKVLDASWRGQEREPTLERWRTRGRVRARSYRRRSAVTYAQSNSTASATKEAS